MYRPKVEIGIFVLNSKCDKILLGKRFGEGLWTLPGGKLNFGDSFEDCAVKELKKQVKLDINSERLIEICTFNALDKKNKFHSLEIDFLLKLTEKEESEVVNNDTFSFETWSWFNIEEMIDTLKLFCTIQMFITKFKIKNIDDIINMSEFCKLVK